MKIEIKNVKGEVIFSHECEENTASKTVEAALKLRINLSYADLGGADLSGAYLRYADLRYANLSGADLSGANLRYANLCRANLRYANLCRANLRYADLGGADLRGADLSGAYLGGANLSCAGLRYADLSDANLSCAGLRYADLSDADLSGAYLGGADLRGANLRYADLSDADLSGAYLGGADLGGANLSGVLFSERTSFFPCNAQKKGLLWDGKQHPKKIVKLLITEDSKRSSATSLKCRCSKAKVLDIQEADGSPSNVNEVKSDYNDSFIYKIGEVIKVDDFDENRWNECSTGIHFFVSRDMAVRYY